VRIALKRRFDNHGGTWAKRSHRKTKEKEQAEEENGVQKQTLAIHEYLRIDQKCIALGENITNRTVSRGGAGNGGKGTHLKKHGAARPNKTHCTKTAWSQEEEIQNPSWLTKEGSPTSIKRNEGRRHIPGGKQPHRARDRDYGQSDGTDPRERAGTHREGVGGRYVNKHGKNVPARKRSASVNVD